MHCNFSVLEMVQCETLKVIKVIKWSIHFGLFVAFIILTCLAFADLLSNKTTFHISNEYKNQVLPSLTLCPTGQGFLDLKSTIYHNNSAYFWDKWATLKFSVLFEDGTRINWNSTSGSQYATIEHYCKPNPDRKESYIPCITLNIHNIDKKIYESDVILRLKGMRTL